MTGRQHFWRYYDLIKRQIVDNCFEIMQLIACGPETPRYPPPYEEINIFEVQELVIESILRSSEHQQAVTAAPKIVSEEQIAISEILSKYVNHPGVSRDEIRGLRKFLKQPLEGVYITKIRQVLQEFQTTDEFDKLLVVILEIRSNKGEANTGESKIHQIIGRDSLRLMCYEYICA